MTTELLTPEATQAQLIRFQFRKQDEVVADIKARYTGLTVAKDGFKTVKAARIEIKNLRCSVENLRKDLKADVLERGKLIDEEATRLKNLLIPIENALAAEEEAEEKRKADEARAKVEAKEKRLQARISDIAAFGVTPDVKQLKEISDEDYLAFRHQCQADFLERQRQAEEAARIQAEKEAAEKAERDRLAALHAEEMRRQAEELAIRERELQAEREKIEAERQAAEAIRLEQLRIEQEARDKAEAERQAIIAAEREALRKEQEAFAAQQAALKAEQDRLAAIERAKAEEAARIERERLAAEEAARLQAIETARLEALKPEIELAEDLQRHLGQVLSIWFEDRPNRAWFGYAEKELSAAALRIVEHVRNS